jgi:hypothetical protein
LILNAGNIGWIYGMIPLAKAKRCMTSGDWHARAKPRFVLAVARAKNNALLEALKEISNESLLR